MTDFVNRLLGVAGVDSPPIRPLIGSLFEPRTARRTDDEPLPMGAVTDLSSQRTDPRPAPPVDRPRAVDVESTARRTESAPRIGHDVTPPARLSPPTVPDPINRQPAPRPATPASVATPPPDRSAPPGSPTRPVRPETRQVDPIVDPTPVHRNTTHVVPAAAEPARGHPVRPVPERARPTGTTPGARPVTRRDRAPEPVVHISIGRIEVRATQETAPRRDQPRRQPALNLDDYLRKRSGG